MIETIDIETGLKRKLKIGITHDLKEVTRHLSKSLDEATLKEILEIGEYVNKIREESLCLFGH